MTESKAGKKSSKKKSNQLKYPRSKTIKALFALSGNQCYFPDCETPVFDIENGSIIGIMCHIKGKKPDAARYDPNQSDEDKHGLNNLLIMCGPHHKVIDDSPEIYTVSRLLEIKAEHEALCTGKNELNPEELEKFDFKKSETDWIKLILTGYNSYLESQAEFEESILILGYKISAKIGYEIYNFYFRKFNKNTKGYTEKLIPFQEMLIQIQNSNKKFIILKGESGVGKTKFTQYLKSHFAKLILKKRSRFIPVFINLGHWRPEKGIIDYISEKVNGIKINNLLRNGFFIVLLDGFDEIDRNLRLSFIRELLSFKENFPKNKLFITIKAGITERRLERESSIFVMKHPNFENLSDYVKNNFDVEIDELAKELQSKKLIEFAKNPLFLNYILVYKNKLGKFPNSKYEIIDNLIQNYFNEHLEEKLIELSLDIPKKILSLIAYRMIFELNTHKLNQTQFRQIIFELISELKSTFKISGEISEEEILDFIVTYNLIVLEDEFYSFWHSSLLDYFSSSALIEIINSSLLKIPPGDLFKRFNAKNSVIMSFPHITNIKYKSELKQKNIFLYIDSLLEEINPERDELNFVSKILPQKVKSEFRYIREITWILIQKYLNFLEKPEEFIINIINQTNKGEVVRWALLELGNLKVEKTREFLLKFKKFDYEIDRMGWIEAPLEGAVLIALSNFNDQKIQDKIIDNIMKKWKGIFFLNSIGVALSNIVKRNKLTPKSYKKILKIFKNPKKFDNKLPLSYDIRRMLQPIIIEYNDSSSISQLFELLKEEVSFQRFCIIDIISKILTDNQLENFISLMKDESVSVKVKEDISFILLDTNKSIKFEDLFEILEKIQDKGFRVEPFDLDKIQLYYDTHPEIEYSRIFSNIVKLFLKEEVHIKNIDISKLVNFLESYQEYPHPLVQENVLELLGKCEIEKIKRKKRFPFFSQEAYTIMLKIISRNDLFIAVKRIEDSALKCIHQPDRFHSLHLFRDLITILLNYEEIEVSKKIFDEFLQSKIDYSSFNCYFLKFVSKFPAEYTLKVLNHFVENFLKLKDKRESQLGMLFSAISPIAKDKYIETCLKLMNIFAENEETILFDQLFGVLFEINPTNYEKKICDLIPKIKSEQGVWRGLNLLAFIGSEKSVELAKKFIGGTNNRLKQMAFFCIRKIRERQNIDWYNNEETIIKKK